MPYTPDPRPPTDAVAVVADGLETAVEHATAALNELTRAIGGGPGAARSAALAVGGLAVALVHARIAGRAERFDAFLAGQIAGRPPAAADWLTRLLGRVRRYADLSCDRHADPGAVADARAEAIAMILNPNFLQYLPMWE